MATADQSRRTKRSPRPGRPPATSREEIAARALSLANEKGLDAVTIRGLAEHMNVAPMTLYKYVPTKDDLIDLMVATALSSFRTGGEPEQSWQDRVLATMLSLLETLQHNHAIIELLVDNHALIGPDLDQRREDVLSIFEGSPLSPTQAIDAFHSLGAFVVGLAAVETARARRAEEVTAHIDDLAEKNYPGLTRHRDLWMRPIPQPSIKGMLRHLICGLGTALHD